MEGGERMQGKALGETLPREDFPFKNHYNSSFTYTRVYLYVFNMTFCPSQALFSFIIVISTQISFFLSFFLCRN